MIKKLNSDSDYKVGFTQTVKTMQMLSVSLKVPQFIPRDFLIVVIIYVWSS